MKNSSDPFFAVISEYRRQLVERIEATIQNGAISPREREDQLWEAAQRFWGDAFPAGISPQDRHAIWVAIVDECELETRDNGKKILDVLTWPATGDIPAWIRGRS